MVWVDDPCADAWPPPYQGPCYAHPPLAVVLFVCLGVLTPAPALAQQAAPTGYTYVAEWDASRDKWSEITACSSSTS
jgi:hypothetical protein